MLNIPFPFSKDKHEWIWEAHYDDGSFLRQTSIDGSIHQIAEIDQKRLVLFKMVCEDSKVCFHVYFKPGMKLIHFYRVTGSIGPMGKIETTKVFFGYEKRVESHTVKTLMFIDDKDNLHIVDENI